MTNSISTTVVEVTKNIHDTVIMASWQSMSMPTTWQFNLILCQVVMTKTVIGYDVMVYVKMSHRHLKQCHICIQSVIIEQKTLNDSCHKHALTLLHIQVMSWLWRCHV